MKPSAQIRMPVFESINQCSSATGVPVAVLRSAKKSGCMAFKHSRIDFAEFIKWFFSQGGELDSENWPVRCKRAEALIKENQLEKVQGKTLDRDDVARAIGKSMSLLASTLDRKIKVELPPNLKGRSEAEIMERLEVALAEACDVARIELETVTNSH